MKYLLLLLVFSVEAAEVTEGCDIESEPETTVFKDRIPKV